MAFEHHVIQQRRKGGQLYRVGMVSVDKRLILMLSKAVEALIWPVYKPMIAPPRYVFSSLCPSSFISYSSHSIFV